LKLTLPEGSDTMLIATSQFHMAGCRRFHRQHHFGSQVQHFMSVGDSTGVLVELAGMPNSEEQQQRHDQPDADQHRTVRLIPDP